MAAKKNAAKDDERRDSPRVPMRFLLRDVSEGGSYVEREGDLSLGGIYWRGKYPPHGTDVEVRFRLAGVPKEVRAKAKSFACKTAATTSTFTCASSSSTWPASWPSRSTSTK
ncbi:MAG: hypothetical protein IPJ65_02975 [Archangiaceae bacterium]|nr:hypothetical protein [Archangiaceae bacterium]